MNPSAGRERGESTRNDGRRRVGENGSIRYRMREAELPRTPVNRARALAIFEARFASLYR